MSFFVAHLSPELPQNSLQMRIERRFQLDGFTRAGVLEGEPPGVEKLPLQAEDVLFAAVNRIADYRAFEPGQVNPDLVGPARFQADFQQAVSARPRWPGSRAGFPSDRGGIFWRKRGHVREVNDITSAASGRPKDQNPKWSFSTVRALNCCCKRRSAAGVRATIISPEVSRSSR